ncbi:TrmH family RNA methyltransferase [Formosa maritima]|uniref:TrmH family RNA methyltransferase n=1 Tax=Formosa maritima TaxID=2592046 RepID=A0A5D0GIS8_9FLAO|nr:TrmH family RNA methyltransferase [Formosa maritima]TYA58898.1 TrmH family RNA methyltransferase [Formosa maritima]
MKQLTHYNTDFTKQTFPITLVCDNITNAPNIGSLFRAADAFGVEKILFCGSSIPLGRKMTKTSRAAEKVVSFEEKESIFETIQTLKSENYKIISLEITSNSQPLNTFKFSKEYKFALIIGDENFGVSEEVLKLSDAIIHINMFGQNSSMNVVQATSITLYEITNQLK